MNHYEVLGVNKNSSKDEIKTAYRKMARRYHTDTNKDNEAESKIKQINIAYGVLSDDKKKREYDELINPRMNLEDFSNFFRQENIYGNRGNPGNPGSGFYGVPIPGEDINIDISIDLGLSMKGGPIETSVNSGERTSCDTCQGTRNRPGYSGKVICDNCGGSRRVLRSIKGRARGSTGCPKCNSTGNLPINPCVDCRGNGFRSLPRNLTISIPAGVSDGSKLRIAGHGKPGLGTKPGDLYVTIKIKEHEIFERKGQDLYCDLEIPMFLALKGGKASVETIDGFKLTFSIPKGISSGATSVRLQGKGVAHPMKRTKGDLYVTLKVKIPDVKSTKAMELIEELEKVIESESITNQ